MLGNSINYAERVEESRQVEKIKKVLIKQASEFLPSYYAVCYYGKSSSGRLLKPEEYRKRWDRNKVIKTHKLISNGVRKCFGVFLYFGLVIGTMIMKILRATVIMTLPILIFFCIGETQKRGD